jgi:ferritin
MISKRIEEAVNEQINAEFYSSYLYLSMSAYFDSIDLPGFANWMIAQAQEEISHGMKMYKFIQERGGKVTLKPIKGPETEWDSPLAIFEGAYAHEQLVTGLINDLVNLAIEEKDHATKNFLDWFIDEQVEEEASASEVVQQLKMIGDNGYGLLMLDREMGQRIFTPPAEGTE